MQSETVSATAGPAGVRADSDTTTESTSETEEQDDDEPRSSSCSFTSDVDQLSTRTKAAQLLVVGVQSYDQAHRAIEIHGVGGILVNEHFRSELLEDGNLGSLRSLSDKPLMVGATGSIAESDAVRDLVGPVRSTTDSLASATEDEALALGREKGEQLAALGFTTYFGPGLDSVTAISPPERAPGVARAFGNGMLDAGVTPVGRQVPASPAESTSVEQTASRPTPAAPEHSGSSADFVGHPETATLMTHVEIPGLTEPDVVASMSPSAYESLRTGAHGGEPYDGVVFTEDLLLHDDVSEPADVPEAALESLLAGADAPLWDGSERVGEVIDTIESAVLDGRYAEEQLNAAFSRNLELRRKDNCGF